jgi:hypothetical protein
MDDDGAVAGLIRKAGQRVVRIDNGNPIDDQPIDIEVRLQRTNRQGPNAVCSLLKWNRRASLADSQQDGPTAQRNRSCIGRLETERHRAVVTNLWRNDVRAVGVQILDVLVRIPVQIHVGLLRTRGM